MSCQYRKNLQEHLDNPSQPFKEHLKDCEECAKDVEFLSLLKSSLIDEAKRTDQPGPGCPDEDTLAAYLDDKVSEGKEEEILAHLAECSACRKQVYQIQSLNQEVETVPLAKPSFLEQMIAWFEPLFTPKLAYAPIAAGFAVLVAVLAIWGLISPSGYDRDEIRVALSQGRGAYQKSLSPEQYSFKQYATGTGALALVNDASGEAANRLAVSFLAEALADMDLAKGVEDDRFDQLAAEGLGLLANKLESVSGLAPLAKESRELATRFKGSLASKEDLQSLILTLDSQMISTPRDGYLADLGVWIYQIKRAADEGKELKAGLELQDSFQNGAKKYLKKSAPSFYTGLQAFLTNVDKASNSDSPQSAVKEACDAFLAKIL